MNKKRCFYTIADDNNMVHYGKLKKSLSKFHPDIELRLFDQRFVESFGDPQFYYRATPILAMKLFNEGYDEVTKLDADQIILGDLSDIWNGDFDAGCVLNDPSHPIKVWDSKTYANCGLVVLKSKEFVLHWFRLCQSGHFDNYQFREQDILSLLTSDYFNYKVKWLDSDKAIYGEYAKPIWSKFILRGDKVVMDKTELKIIHFAGGGSGLNKGNYKIKFQEEVCSFIDKLIQ